MNSSYQKSSLRSIISVKREWTFLPAGLAVKFVRLRADAESDDRAVEELDNFHLDWVVLSGDSLLTQKQADLTRGAVVVLKSAVRKYTKISFLLLKFTKNK